MQQQKQHGAAVSSTTQFGPDKYGPACLQYAQVSVVSQGTLGFIAVGFMSDDVLQSRLPGWEAHSYGGWGGPADVVQHALLLQQRACGRPVEMLAIAGHMGLIRALQGKVFVGMVGRKG